MRNIINNGNIPIGYIDKLKIGYNVILINYSNIIII